MPSNRRGPDSGRPISLPPNQRPRVLFALDFNSTLGPGGVREKLFAQRGIDNDEFERRYEEYKKYLEKHDPEKLKRTPAKSLKLNFIGREMISGESGGGITNPITMKQLADFGKTFQPYEGVQQFLARHILRADKKGVDLICVVISGGWAPILRNMDIATQRLVVGKRDFGPVIKQIVGQDFQPSWFVDAKTGQTRETIWPVSYSDADTKPGALAGCASYWAVHSNEVGYVGNGHSDEPACRAVTTGGGVAIGLYPTLERADNPVFWAEDLATLASFESRGLIIGKAEGDFREGSDIDKLFVRMTDTLVLNTALAESFYIKRRPVTRELNTDWGPEPQFVDRGSRGLSTRSINPALPFEGSRGLPPLEPTGS